MDIKSKIHSWAVESQLSFPENCINSSFKKVDIDDSDCYEYNFQTIDEFEKYLSEMWKDSNELIKIKHAISIEFIKKKKKIIKNESDCNKKNNINIPDYIYNF